MQDGQFRSLLLLIVPLGILAVLFLFPGQPQEVKKTDEPMKTATVPVPPPSAHPAMVPPTPQMIRSHSGVNGDYRGSCAGHLLRNQQPVSGTVLELTIIADAPLDGKELRDMMPLRPGNRLSVVTDSQGAFHFDNLPAGHYGFRAETDTELATDDVPVRVVPATDGPDSFASTSARRRMNTVLELTAAEPLGGRVLTADGQPARGAEIYPFCLLGESPLAAAESYILGRVCTADGSFFFPKLKKGDWQFVVSFNGNEPTPTDWYSTGTRDAEVRPGQNQKGRTPDIVGKTFNGEIFKLSALRGKYVLVDFWATWCGPCRGETPSMRAAYDAFKNDPRLVMVGLSLDREIAAPKQYVADNGMAWTQVFLGDWSKTSIPSDYGVEGIPAIMLFDPEGKCVARDLRGPAIRETIAKFLANTGQPAAGIPSS